MNTSTVRIEREGHIAVMYLDKPPVNAIDRVLVADGMKGLQEIKADNNIHAVVITGAGRCFSAGLDLKVAPYYSAAEQRMMVEELNEVVRELYGFPMPAVAAINGHVIAGGFILAISCDYRIGAASEYKVGVTESRVGVPFPVATMEVMCAELSPAIARRMTLTGRNMGSQEAFHQGILDELQEPGSVLARAKEVAMDLGTMPRDAYAKIKRQLRGNTIQRIRKVIDEGSDPLLNEWIKEEGRTASSAMIAGNKKN